MTSRLKNLTAFLLVLFFAVALLCSSMVAPGRALASISGCSHSDGAMDMMPCEHPTYLCGFDSLSNLVSRGAFGLPSPDDSLKNYLSVAVGEASIASSNSEASLIAREWQSAFPAAAHKVSIRLFNSTLNL